MLSQNQYPIPNEVQWLENITYPKPSFKAVTIKLKMTQVDIFFFW